MSTQFSSIWPKDRILSGATTPGLSVSGSNGNEGELQILQSSHITGISPSDCLVSYLGHSLMVVVGGHIPLQRILQPQPTVQATIYICALYIYIWIYIVSKAGDRRRGHWKVPFSIATTPRCREWRYSFPYIYIYIYS